MLFYCLICSHLIATFLIIVEIFYPRLNIVVLLNLRHFQSQAIIEELTAAYGDDAPSKATIYNWIREFKSSRTDVTSQKSTGRPLEIGAQQREKLESIFRNDRRITKESLAEVLMSVMVLYATC